MNPTPLTIILAVCAFLTVPTPPVSELAANQPTDFASSSNETSKSGLEAPTSADANPVAACWQIVAYDSDHDPLFIASAFAISDNLLGTNAHVVEPAAEALRKGGFIHAVQNETGMERYVSRMWLHPGYDEEAAVGPDVGVIEVTESLPLFLAFASDATLHGLAVLDEVRLYGFPGDVARAIDLEQLLHGGLRPRATCLTGRITSLRPFNTSRDASPLNTLLIQHDIPATGGTSGSPILNERGEVIAINSALTHDELAQNGFAVRVDVLRGFLGMVRGDVLPPVDMEYDLGPDPEPEPEPESESEFQAFINGTAEAVGGLPVAAIICIGIVSLTFLQLATMRANLQRQSIERMDRFVEVMQTKITGIERTMNGMRPQLNNSYGDDKLITVSSDDLPPLFSGRWTGSTAVGLVLMAIGAVVWTKLPLPGVLLVALSLTLVVASSRTCVRTLNRIDRRLPSRARLVLRLQRSKRGANVFDTGSSFKHSQTEVSDAANYTI